MNPVSLVLVDDHSLLRNGLASMLKESGYPVLFEADNGKEFIQKMNPKNLPEIVLLDINMPEMDGYETAAWLKQNHPEIKVLALSMYDNEDAIIKMLKAGVRGYILKDAHPSELKAAIESVHSKGYHYSEMVTGRLMRSLAEEKTQDKIKELVTEREMEFLKLCSSELTYKEIAEKMFVSPRTIDGYRDALFEKLNIKSRVGLVLYAIKNGIVQVQ